jgi:hypothetical protein
MLVPGTGLGALRRRPPPSWTITLLLAGLWLVAGPATPDLAAQLHRVGMFRSDGFAVWDNRWYGGHHVPGYSLVFPAVGAAIGVRLAGAVAAVASAAIFEALVGPRRSTAACWWFAVGCSADLLIGRLTYALGVAFGLAAVTALVRARPRLAVLLAAACATTSPVAGLFLALIMIAAAMGTPDRRRDALIAGTAALTVVLVLSAAFPEGGSQPFSARSFAVTLGISLAAAIAVGPQRHLRVPLALYSAVVGLCYLVSSPMGGNVVRLGTAFTAPALLLAARRAPAVRRGVLVLLLCAAAAWQWIDPFTQVAHGWDDPSTAASYYRPLVARLRAEHAGAARVEVPFTRGHWETVFLARHFALARGWERQLDRRLNPLFYRARLDPGAYHRWLRVNAVGYVALPDSPMDGAGRAEARLVAAGPSFLQPVWHGAHWRLFRVRDALPLASGRVDRVSLGDATVRLRVTQPGPVLLRVHWTPYWRVLGGPGCVAQRGGWTLLEAGAAGRFTLAPRFSVGRMLQRLPSCPGAPAARGTS